MKESKKIWEKIKQLLGLSLKTGKKSVDKSNNKPGGSDIPEDILKQLPKGVVVKKITITPQSILKWMFYLILIFWIVSAIGGLSGGAPSTSITLSEALEKIKSGKISEVTVIDNEVVLKETDGGLTYTASKEVNASMVEIMNNAGIDISKVNLKVENRAGLKAFGDILGIFLTVGLPLLFIIWFFRKSSGGAGAGGMFGFGKSPAKLFVKGKQKITFKDVAGVEEAKKDLEEIVYFLKNPAKFHKLGARAPRGVLLIGPSGVGKTLLAKAVAGEANVPFFSMAGSEFMEMLVGVGASRARDLFATAKKAGRAIIFIDEIDAIGRMRGGLDGGHGEREQTLNQILVEMDGFESNTAVVVLAATNRGDLLDPALMRPGRFDRRVILELPDLEARKEVLKIHAKGKPFSRNVNWDSVARRTVGFSGADLENMLNEAAIAAAVNNRKSISSNDIEEAALKVKLGAAKRRTQTEEDKLMTAYHEAGHAIVNFVEDLDPVHRVSIVSRGMALGFTLIPPRRDEVHRTKSNLIKRMAMAMGGRAAEQIVFGDITTGAASDITHVTQIARNMVTEWGMSDLGPVSLGPQIDVNDFGKAYMEPSKISDGMMSKVDEEIKKLVNTALERAVVVLKENRKKLDEIAKLLAEKETLDDKEFAKLMG